MKKHLKWIVVLLLVLAIGYTIHTFDMLEFIKSLHG